MCGSGSEVRMTRVFYIIRAELETVRGGLCPRTEHSEIAQRAAVAVYRGIVLDETLKLTIPFEYGCCRSNLPSLPHRQHFILGDAIDGTRIQLRAPKVECRHLGIVLLGALGEPYFGCKRRRLVRQCQHKAICLL